MRDTASESGRASCETFKTGDVRTCRKFPMHICSSLMLRRRSQTKRRIQRKKITKLRLLLTLRRCLQGCRPGRTHEYRNEPPPSVLELLDVSGQSGQPPLCSIACYGRQPRNQSNSPSATEQSAPAQVVSGNTGGSEPRGNQASHLKSRATEAASVTDDPADKRELKSYHC